MEILNLKCYNCGSSDVHFDAMTRMLHCNSCHQDMLYSRASLCANEQISHVIDNAAKFFLAGKRDSAMRYAQDVLNIIPDHAGALYIMAYVDEFGRGKTGAMQNYFRREQQISMEGDEMMALMRLFTASIYNMRGYEAEMLTLLWTGAQDPSDEVIVPHVIEFTETICPYCISKYPSADFMTPEREELYTDLVSHVNLPKTCFALLKSIQTNPESPFVTHTFNMKGHTQYFLEHYVMPVGRILQAMVPSQYKAKFIAAYGSTVKKYQANARAAG